MELEQMMRNFPQALSNLVCTYLWGTFSLRIREIKENLAQCLSWFRNKDDQLVVTYLLSPDKGSWQPKGSKNAQKLIFSLAHMTSTSATSLFSLPLSKKENLAIEYESFILLSQVETYLLIESNLEGKGYRQIITAKIQDCGLITIPEQEHKEKSYDQFFLDPLLFPDIRRDHGRDRIFSVDNRYSPETVEKLYHSGLRLPIVRHGTNVRSVIPYKGGIIVLDQQGTIWKYKTDSKVESRLANWSRVVLAVPVINLYPQPYHRVEMQIQDDVLWIKQKNRFWYRSLFGCLD